MNKLYFYIKVAIYLLLLSGINSCKKEVLVLEKEVKDMKNPVNSQMQVKTISFEEVQKNLSQLNIGSLGTYLKGSRPFNNRISLKNNDTGDEYILITDSVKMITIGSRNSYTFAIKQGRGQKSTFRNLTIDKSEAGVIAFIATYRPFNDWAKKYKKNKNLPFEGKLSIEKIDLGNNLPGVKLSKKGNSTKAECSYYWVYRGSQDFNCPCDNHGVGQTCGCYTKPYTQYYYSLESLCVSSGSGGTTVITSSGNGGGGGSSSPYPNTATTLPPGYNPECENGGMSVSAIGDDGDCPLDNPNSQLIAKVNRLVTTLNLEYFQAEILADNEWLVDQLTADLQNYPVDDAFRAAADLAISLTSSPQPQINNTSWMQDVLYAALPAEMRPHIEPIKQKVKFELALVYLKEPHLRTLTYTYPWEELSLQDKSLRFIKQPEKRYIYFLT